MRIINQGPNHITWESDSKKTVFEMGRGFGHNYLDIYLPDNNSRTYGIQRVCYIYDDVREVWRFKEKTSGPGIVPNFLTNKNITLFKMGVDFGNF